MFLCRGVLAAVDGERIEVQGVVAGRTEVMESVEPQVGHAAARTARQAGSCFFSPCSAPDASSHFAMSGPRPRAQSWTSLPL